MRLGSLTNCSGHSDPRATKLVSAATRESRNNRNRALNIISKLFLKNINQILHLSLKIPLEISIDQCSQKLAQGGMIVNERSQSLDLIKIPIILSQPIPEVMSLAMSSSRSALYNGPGRLRVAQVPLHHVYQSLTILRVYLTNVISTQDK